MVSQIIWTGYPHFWASDHGFILFSAMFIFWQYCILAAQLISSSITNLQYQHYEQSLLASNHWIQISPLHMTLEIHAPAPQNLRIYLSQRIFSNKEIVKFDWLRTQIWAKKVCSAKKKFCRIRARSLFLDIHKIATGLTLLIESEPSPINNRIHNFQYRHKQTINNLDIFATSQKSVCHYPLQHCYEHI